MDQDQSWKRYAFAKYRLNERLPWRVQIFCPAPLTESANRQLNKMWGDIGDNLSVPLSSTGKPPVEHFGCSGVVSPSMFKDLEVVVSQHSGMIAFVGPNNGPAPFEILIVLGLPFHPMVGNEATFDECANWLNLKRMDALAFFRGLQSSHPEILLQAVINLGPNVDEGKLISAVTIPWFEIIDILKRDPQIAFQITPQKWEEIIAGAYHRAGFDEVILTPRSGDLGRDIIAVKRGLGSIRIIDQVKAYKRDHLVTANDVRALLGVLQGDGASKGFLTTTSNFAPKLRVDPLITPFIPSRLELVSGDRLLQRLQELAKPPRRPSVASVTSSPQMIGILQSGASSVSRTPNSGRLNRRCLRMARIRRGVYRREGWKGSPAWMAPYR